MPRFPPLAPAGSRSPASSVLSRHYDFLPPIPPHFVSFAWRYLGCTRCFRSSADESAAEAWSWSPGISGRDIRRGDDRISQVPGEPQCPFAHVLRPRQDCLHQTITVQQRGPRYGKEQRLPRSEYFRRSIAWLSDSLSTLRSAGYPDPTQDSLPAAGQALLDGLSTRRVPMKGFRVASLHLILLSQALLGAMSSTHRFVGTSRTFRELSTP